jgi:hypothetical protein
MGISVPGQKKGQEGLDGKQNTSCGKPEKHAAALGKIEEAIQAVELCQGELTADGYKELRARLGHLMDALYKVGDALSKAT